MDNGTRRKGRVQWFHGGKGYGFIAPLDGGPDVFVHYSGIRGEGYRTLHDDQIVEFTLVAGRKGPMATDVWVIG